ncbi:alkylhydroperoxidase AhpD family core domain [SAR116 cluster alpha proteobacterium HIMB100]|nr:alkylhydroperoxidase AhpD family core domain [SAR116 cluster alpha proteobacterium HIMB100]
MTSPDISRFPVPEVNNLPDDVKQIITDVQEKAGFIPNVFLTLAHRPDELRAFWAYHEALMRRESGLSKAEREMIVVATSAANSCLYCVVAHGAILRIYEKSTQISDQIATNFRKADITDRQKAMLIFAEKVALQSERIGEDDFETLHGYGFSDEDIWDIGAITSLFALSNRMASLTSMRPNDDFYAMGRSFADKS